jgi:hypothetical protein
LYKCSNSFLWCSCEKSPTIWWIKFHNSGMKIRNFTIKYTDHKTINSNNSEIWSELAKRFLSKSVTCETDRRTLVYHNTSLLKDGRIQIIRVMELYSSNCRRFFVCRTVNWEPLGQFTSNFAQLLELIVLRSVYFLVKFWFFIPEFVKTFFPITFEWKI